MSDHFDLTKIVSSPRQVKKNEHVYEQGDLADEVYYIQKGKIKVTVVSEHGKEAIIAILDEAMFFGETVLAGASLRIATTIAMEETVLFVITKTEMQHAIKHQPKFADTFMSYLLKRNMRVEADLIDQLFNSTERRLARLLLLLAQYGLEDGKSQPIPKSITQESLAEMIGATRSHTSQFMNKFRKLGFITYNGHIEVHPSLMNAVLHEKPQIDTGELSVT